MTFVNVELFCNLVCGSLQGDLVWFDPGVGHVLPGEVMEFHRAAQVLTVQALIAGTVSHSFNSSGNVPLA